MIKVQVKRTGPKGALSRYSNSLGRRVAWGLWFAGKALLRESLPLVPWDTLALADSGRVSRAGNGRSWNMFVVVGYGGSDFPPRTEFSYKEGRIVTRIPYDYAVGVHEDKSKAHSSGQTDYLREPCLTKHQDIIAAFRQGVRRV